VNWIVDADIAGFFDAVSHEWLMRFVEHRIGDRRINRLGLDLGPQQTCDFLGKDGAAVGKEWLEAVEVHDEAPMFDNP
jgi:hypothetical protein